MKVELFPFLAHYKELECRCLTCLLLPGRSGGAEREDVCEADFHSQVVRLHLSDGGE